MSGKCYGLTNTYCERCTQHFLKIWMTHCVKDSNDITFVPNTIGCILFPFTSILKWNIIMFSTLSLVMHHFDTIIIIIIVVPILSSLMLGFNTQHLKRNECFDVNMFHMTWGWPGV